MSEQVSMKQLCDEVASLRSIVEDQNKKLLGVVEKLVKLVENSKAEEQIKFQQLSQNHATLIERISKLESNLKKQNNNTTTNNITSMTSETIDGTIAGASDEDAAFAVTLTDVAKRVIVLLTKVGESRTAAAFNTNIIALMILVQSFDDSTCLKVMESISTFIASQPNEEADTQVLEHHIIPVIARALACIQHSHLKQQAIGDVSHVLKYFRNLPDHSLTSRDNNLLAVSFQLMGMITTSEEALRFFDEAVKVVPHFGYAYFSRGALKQTQFSEIDDALKDYNTSIEYSPTNIFAYNNKAVIYANFFSDYQSALLCYDKIIELDPKNSVAYNNRGQIHELQFGDLNLALENYNRAIDCDSTNTFAYFNRGHFYVNHCKDFTKAIENFSKVIELNAKDAKAYFFRASVYHKHLQDFNHALEDYIKAIQCDPSFASAHVERGQLYADYFKDYDKALEDYGKALELDSKNSLAYLNRAILYHTVLKNTRNALEDYSKAIEMDGKNSYAWYTRGILLEQLGEKEKAERDLSKSLKLDPTSTDTETALKRVQAALGRSSTSMLQKKKIRPKRNLKAANNSGSAFEVDGQSAGTASMASPASNIDDYPSPFADSVSPFTVNNSPFTSSNSPFVQKANENPFTKSAA